MPITLTRIDNRLLHGIVATQWAGKSGAQRIMIIDDEAAGNELTKASIRLARPTGMAISIITLEQALANFRKGKYDDHKVFLIVKTPLILAELIRAGIKIPELVVGGTARPKDETGVVRLYQRAYATEPEIEVYKELIAAGTMVYAQYVPADSVISLDEFF